MLLAGTGSAVLAQGRDPDFDPATRNASYIGPNSGRDYVVRGLEWWYGERYDVGANLVLEAGADLRVISSHVELRGDVVLKHNGKLSITDSFFSLKNSYPREFNFFWRGGNLYTDRVTIGGTRSGSALISNFWLNNGVWDAFHTTVQYSGGILLGFSRFGYYGQVDQKGGTLHAQGLYRGEASDALLMSGCGDAYLKDSTFPIGLYIYADGPTSFTTSLDLSTKNTIAHDVYGDPTVHDAVTRGIPGSPWRLELSNVRVPFWNLFANECSDRGAPTKLVMLNAEALMCSFHGEAVTGSPVLGGNWSQHYSRMPGLPSTRIPGHHPIPPGCSVKLGNVTFETGTGQNDWAHIHAWGLYLRGSSSNVTVKGASAIAEVWLGDGTLNLVGDASFNAGAYANTISVNGTGKLLLEQAAIGEFGTGRSLLAEIATNDSSTCTIKTCRISDLRLLARNSSQISVTNPFIEGKLMEERHGGSIHFGKAAPWEGWDLQNLDFESGVTSGSASFWQKDTASGVDSNDRRPNTGGSRSFEYWSPSPGALFKDVFLSPETHLQLLGFCRILGLGQGSYFHLKVQNGSNYAYADLAATNAWQLVQVPDYVMGPWENQTRVFFTSGGTSAHARIDDFRVHIANWWDNNNICNMDFEDLNYRGVGLYPDFWKSPDYWKVWGFNAQPESDPAKRRPGSSGGSHSTKLTAMSGTALMLKDITFLRPGDRVRLHGWVRADPPPNVGTYVHVQLGEGNDYWRHNGINQSRVYWADGSWNEFTIDYNVPWPPNKQDFTRLAIASIGAAETVIYLDDLSVTIR